MLQQMFDIQSSVSEMLDIPREFKSIQEAMLGLAEEVAAMGEALEDVALEPKVLETLNFNKADTTAVGAFTFLLEYFVLRGWTAKDLEAAYLMLIGEITKKQEAEQEADSAFYNMLKDVLSGDLTGAIKAFNILEAEVELMNGLNDLMLKDAVRSDDSWEAMAREAGGAN